MSPCKRELSLEFSNSPPCKKKENDDGEARNKRLLNPCPVLLAFTPAVLLAFNKAKFLRILNVKVHYKRRDPGHE